ncbi:UNVERIFIED_CONTAM: hypothetical protein HDU68_000121 [Siphonaria sp. JEL0065]|nr:hypothetical protein HDU68_000121 [Siphonaria sp. JEL0065]
MQNCDPFREITALVSFGESHIDTGNLYTLTSFLWPPATWPKRYFNGGRFTNGPVFVEQLATKLQVPLYNFAFSAATSHNMIRGYTGPEGTTAVPSLNEQISHHFHRALIKKPSHVIESSLSRLSFHDYLSSSNLKSSGSLVTPETSNNQHQKSSNSLVLPESSHTTLAEASSKSSLTFSDVPAPNIGIPPNSMPIDVSSTLFVLTCGGNDHYFNHSSHNCEISVETIVNNVLELVKTLQTVYGAKKIVVFNCQDFARQPNRGSPIKEGTAKEHNRIIERRFRELFGDGSQVNGFVKLFDLCSTIDEIMDDPGRFGVKNVSDAFVGYGGQLAPDDANPNDYLWWDNWHFTEPIHQIIADGIAKQATKSLPPLPKKVWTERPVDPSSRFNNTNQ